MHGFHTFEDPEEPNQWLAYKHTRVPVFTPCLTAAYWGGSPSLTLQLTKEIGLDVELGRTQSGHPQVMVHNHRPLSF